MIFSILLLILAFAFFLAAIHVQYEEYTHRKEQRDFENYFFALKKATEQNESIAQKDCHATMKLVDQLSKELNKPREEMKNNDK